jgi:hypothetical protein
LGVLEGRYFTYITYIRLVRFNNSLHSPIRTLLKKKKKRTWTKPAGTGHASDSPLPAPRLQQQLNTEKKLMFFFFNPKDLSFGSSRAAGGPPPTAIHSSAAKEVPHVSTM